MTVSGDDVRAAALSLPQVRELFEWEMPTFRVAKKLFLTLPEGETSMAVKCPIVERDELVLAEPSKFWVAPHEAMGAWVRVRLSKLDDLEELAAIVTDSWRQAAPPKLVQEHFGG